MTFMPGTLSPPSPTDSEVAAHLELLETLGQVVPGSLNIDRARRIFVNRTLKMAEIDWVGFDMDYTLALYHQANLERLSIDSTLRKLIDQRGYPEAIRTLNYDGAMGRRGIVVDRQFGNLFKMDRYGHVGRVYHGRKRLAREEKRALYRTHRIRLSHPRYAWIDTLFALPEATMYASMVEYADAEPGSWFQNYDKLWQDIRDAIDEAHRDESMKQVIKANIQDYIVRDPDLAPTLHKLRSSGKRLFLLTNSSYDYTEPVMSFLLDGMLPHYPSWQHYFDVTIVAGGKPAFFAEKRPFFELDDNGEKKPLTTKQFVRGRIYTEGNVGEFETLAGQGGDRILYIGDHIYGDMLRAKKSSVWRTAMILQELEEEIVQIEKHRDEFSEIENLERQESRLDAEIVYQQHLLKLLQRTEESLQTAAEPAAGAAPQVAEACLQAKRRLDQLKADLKATIVRMAKLEEKLSHAFNPWWGEMFRSGTENSRFGDQVEDYACVYTGRVSNFLAYSPFRYFRGPRDQMPHEFT